jgi:hypothetical protein
MKPVVIIVNYYSPNSSLTAGYLAYKAHKKIVLDSKGNFKSKVVPTYDEIASVTSDGPNNFWNLTGINELFKIKRD